MENKNILKHLHLNSIKKEDDTRPTMVEMDFLRFELCTF
jgi:hypothetical protein